MADDANALPTEPTSICGCGMLRRDRSSVNKDELLMANWLAVTIARQGCVPHHLVDAIVCVGSEGRRSAHPNTAILRAAEDGRVRT